MKITQKNKPILTLLAVYLLGIICFTVFRFMLFITEKSLLINIPKTEVMSLMFKTFIMGFRFDTVISSYILSLPLLLLLASAYLRKDNQIINTFVKYYLIILYNFSFIICAIDLPFFHNFNSRLNMMLFAWQNTPTFIFGMVIKEFSFYWSIIPLIIFSFIFDFCVIRLFRTMERNTVYEKENFKYFVKYTFMSLLLISLLIVGARGRLARKSPIRIGTAYFSNYGFPNMLGLNPVYTFLRSYIDSLNPENENVKFMKDEDSIESVKKWLGIKQDTGFNSPIARYRNQEGKEIRANVVLIIMESMGTQKLKHFGNHDNLTPNLDKIIDNSYLYTNIYSSGTHTRFGVYSTLFSYPCYLRKHPMKTVEMEKQSGIATGFKHNNYSTIYFTTHDDQFDNIGGFLRANDFDELISQKDYPKDKVLSSLGVPDDYMFSNSFSYLDKLSKKNQPFLAVYLTASDHGPRIIPTYFKPKHKEIEKQSVEYADWSLGEFMKSARQEAWFDNTLFVFVADHGYWLSSIYDLPIERHQIPLAFFSPKLIKEKKTDNKLGSQIDVFPSIMGFLNLPYVNNSLGIDLFHEKRPYSVFTTDDKFAVIDDENLLVIRDKQSNSLYHYKNKDATNYIVKEKKKADEMLNYAQSTIQFVQYMGKSRLMNPQKRKEIMNEFAIKRKRTTESIKKGC